MGVRPHVAHGGAHFAYRPFVHQRHVRRRVFIAPALYGTYYYSDGCYWLRQNALYTGNPYWWNRYYACAYGNGY